MNAASVHLLLNHFPILGALFAAMVLLAGIILNDRKVNQVGLVSLVIFTLISIPAFLSGEGAEEVLEELPGISNAAMHDHEEIAELGFWFMMFTGMVALVSFWLQYRKERLHRIVSIITCILALVAFGVFVQVGLTGGKIRHTETIKPIGPPEQQPEIEYPGEGEDD